MSLTIGSLFSGIGGLELGLEMAGLGPVLWQVEIDPFCRSVLAKHWPEVARHEDITRIDPAELEPVGLICGGFPCQDVSSAGSRAGLAGERSGLWRQFSRVLEGRRPEWVVVENVASGARLWVDDVCRELERLGYEVLPVPVSAADVGAPHLRGRIFIVGRNSNGDQQPVVAVDGEVARMRGAAVADADRQRLWEQQGGGGGESRPGEAQSREHVGAWDAANADEARLQGASTIPRPRAWRVAAGGPWATDTIPLPSLRRVDDGLPSRMDRNHRLRALGNAVVPQCAEVVGWVVRGLAGVEAI